MLILNRKPGDAILIDGGIRVEVLAVEGGSVRLGIDAPASVGIVREEIAARIAEENRRAGATPDAAKWLETFRPASPENPVKAASSKPSPADPSAS